MTKLPVPPDAVKCAMAPEPVSTPAPRATGSVQSRGTTAKPPAYLDNPEWCEDMEYVWRSRMTPRVVAWEKRRRAAARAGDEVRRDYAGARARALAMSRGDVVRACRGRFRTVGCGCGRRDVPVGCDQPALCDWCRKRHWYRWRGRITRSLKTHSRAAIAAWGAQGGHGARPGIYLVTLTGPHSGDIAVDRERMGAAVRSLFKRANAERWWKHYALVWECTPGRDGKGHLHAHIAIVAQWIPYKELHEAWRAAMPGAVMLDIKAPRSNRNAAGQAANYLAKYVTKGVDPGEMTGAKAGELLVATYGHRRVTTSRHFWHERQPECRVCNRKCYLHAAPVGLREHAPAAVIRSYAVRLGMVSTTGDPQKTLALTGQSGLGRLGGGGIHVPSQQKIKRRAPARPRGDGAPRGRGPGRARSGGLAAWTPRGPAGG